MTLEVFQIPELLREQLIEFQTRQSRHPLSELDNYREQLQGHIGVYLLYYQGDFSLYSNTVTALPIYIGKAETPGKRTGKSSWNGGLIGRLREHRNSIRQVENLEVKDFEFVVVAMTEDLVAWGEAVMIRHFQPLWCTVISGFGIHDPGKGRQAQMRSLWDQIHPGRSFALPLPSNPVSIESIQPLVEAHNRRLHDRS